MASSTLKGTLRLAYKLLDKSGCMTLFDAVQKRLTVPVLFVLLLLCLPLDTGPTLKYILSIFLVLRCVGELHADGENYRTLFWEILSNPVTWMIGLLCLFAGLSIFMSIHPWDSARKFLEEYLLNLSIYFAMTLYTAAAGRKTDWFRLILIANGVFLLLYTGLMLQWIVDPRHPWLLDPRFEIGTSTPIAYIIFTFGNINFMVHGIKHTSFFIMLGIAVAFIPLVWNRNRLQNIFITCVNMIILVTTTRRAPLLASIIGMGLAGVLNPKSAKKTLAAAAIALASIILIATLAYVTGHRQYFVREDWGKIIKGDIASQKNASIPIRLMCLKLYTEEVMKHPFKGVGLGKKNIKEVYEETVRKTRGEHPHNLLLNLACELGIQGPIALLMVIGAQAMMFIKCFKTTKSEDVRIIMATALVYMCMFWLSQMTTYAFHHGSSTLYWLFTAVPTGYALAERAVYEKTASLPDV